MSHGYSFRLSLVKRFGPFVALLSTLSAPTVEAAAPMAQTQAPGFYRVMVGSLQVTALLDANNVWPDNMDILFPKLSTDQRVELRKRTHLQEKVDFSTNAFLVNTGKKLILIDTGGRGVATGYGQLFKNMKAAGYSPTQVDDVYITHMHGDHISGLLDGKRPAFPNATVHVDVHELQYWQAQEGGKDTVAKFKPYIVDKRFATFDGNTQLLPELKAVASYGHSKGHVFFVIESQGQRMRFWGDFVVNDKVQLEMPEVDPPFEEDSAKGVTQRRKEFEEVSSQGDLIAGAHFAFPGIGRIRDLGGKYIWVPVDYSTVLRANVSK